MSTGLENWSHASLEQAVLDLQRKAETVDLFHALARDVIARIMTTPDEWVETPMDVRLRLEACIRRAEENAALRKRVEELEEHRKELIELVDARTQGWREMAENAEQEREDYRAKAIQSQQDFDGAAHGCDVLQGKLDALQADLSEAQAAIWRVVPNTITVEGVGVDKGWPGADPFEGPGETYQAAYERVKADLDAARALFLRQQALLRQQDADIDAALDALDYYVFNRFHGAESIAKAKALLEKRRVERG